MSEHTHDNDDKCCCYFNKPVVSRYRNTEDKFHDCMFNCGLTTCCLPCLTCECISDCYHKPFYDRCQTSLDPVDHCVNRCVMLSCITCIFVELVCDVCDGCIPCCKKCEGTGNDVEEIAKVCDGPNTEIMVDDIVLFVPCSKP